MVPANRGTGGAAVSAACWDVVHGAGVQVSAQDAAAGTGASPGDPAAQEHQWLAGTEGKGVLRWVAAASITVCSVHSLCMCSRVLHVHVHASFCVEMMGGAHTDTEEHSMHNS